MLLSYVQFYFQHFSKRAQAAAQSASGFFLESSVDKQQSCPGLQCRQGFLDGILYVRSFPWKTQLTNNNKVGLGYNVDKVFLVAFCMRSLFCWKTMSN
jgi:hypothetical protein